MKYEYVIYDGSLYKKVNDPKILESIGKFKLSSTKNIEECDVYEFRFIDEKPYEERLKVTRND